MSGAMEWIGSIEFASAWALWLLALVPVAAWLMVWRGWRAPVAYSDGSRIGGVGATWRVRLRHVPVVLRTLGLILLVLAAARPREGVGEVRTITRGVAIMACVDRSWSMTAEMGFGDERLQRFDVVKRVLREFVEGNGEELQGRQGDAVGIVKFARYADTACPPVRTRSTLLDILDDLRLAPYTQLEAGTSIGDATALAAARLERLEASLSRGQGDPDFVLTGKVIIMLTDGDEKTGTTRALEAAELAAEWGIRIHAIGVGSPGGRYGFDEATLRGMAERTGGIYRRATDAGSLREVYAEIDALEQTEVTEVSTTNWEEWFWPFLAAGLGCFALGVLLQETVFGRAG